MSPVIDKPLFTAIYDPASSFKVQAGQLLIHGANTEERHGWIEAVHPDQALCIDDVTHVDFAVHFRGASTRVSFRSSSQIRDFWTQLGGGSSVVIDLTTLPHPVWALLVRSGVQAGVDLDVCYTEPRDYNQNPTPTLEGDIFDLSERIEGIRPLPGFASFHDDLEDNFVLIALLGFEGARFAHVVESIEPRGSLIVPIIGVPGFQPEFVFHAYLGNKPALLNGSCYTQVRYAAANCPFSLAYLLEELARENPTALLKIALLGTKPHALGTFLFERRARREVEFVYDHPVRKPKRTSGTARLLLYRVSRFLRHT